jgi:two-component system sensor histidine kinase YesM
MLQRNTTLRWRLMVSISALILVCIAVSGLVISHLYSRTLSQQDQTYTLQLLEQTQRNLDTYVRSTQDQMQLLADDPAIRAYLELDGDASETTRLAAENASRAVLEDYAAHMPQAFGILLTGENGRYLSNEFYRVTKDPLNQESWYLAATRADSPQFLLSRPIRRNLRSWKNYSVNDAVMLTVPVRADSGVLLGAVSVDLRLDELEESLAALRTGRSGSIFVLDQAGEVVYMPTDALVYRVRPEWFQQESAPFLAHVGAQDMTFLFSTSGYTGWKAIGMFPNGAGPELLETMKRIIALVFALTLTFGLVMALILTNTITKPISYLRRLMQQAEQGDLAVHYRPCNSMDVDRLGASFNTMIDRIRTLMDTLVEEQKRKRKAEMDALQAQINPHFLYNTLDTIHWMAKDYHATDIEKMISALTKLFRVSLSGGSEFIPLAQEISHVQNYLYIQKVRYEDKLNYRFDVDENLLGLTVLKLIIQPLAENALYHGIKPKDGGGSILIRVYRSENTLCVDVSDDGVGLAPEREQQLNESLENREKGNGFGIFNVNERLVMYFEAEYGVRLRQNPGGGVVSELRHPLLEKAPE